MSLPAEPFDRAARRRSRDRALALVAHHDPVLRHVQSEIAARHALLGAPEGLHLRIGLLCGVADGDIGADPSARACAMAGGVQCDEDRLPFRDASLARISSCMTLHGVNDLPGALILMRRTLVAGGRLVAGFPAGYSLGALRDALLKADLDAGAGVAARTGPTVDPAQAAALLQRAGFHEPVADVERLTIRVPSLAVLAKDIRGQGDSGWLAARPRGLMTPGRWAAAEALFQAGAGPDGRVPVGVELLYLSGRAPPSSQENQGRT